MTLQEYTDKLQELCHQGHAQKDVVLYATIGKEVFMYTLPKKADIAYVLVEDAIGINLGDYND